MTISEHQKWTSGQHLIGDDYSPEQIEAWYRDEQDAYATLVSHRKGPYRYPYHAMNMRHGYRHLPSRHFNHVLGFGSAFGDELSPIASQIDAITILDPGRNFAVDRLFGKNVTYKAPNPNGKIPADDMTFDLITCFGVLHHIPNVSFVASELVRVLQMNGYLLIREPTVSMGDWRKTRPGLTQHERGIPIDVFRNILDGLPVTTIAKTVCVFPPWIKLASAMGLRPFASPILTLIDEYLSKLFSWNKTYHPKNNLHRLRPAAVFYCPQKQPSHIKSATI